MTHDETQSILRGLGRIESRMTGVETRVGEHTAQLDTLLTAAAKVEAVTEYRREHRAKIAAIVTLLVGASSTLTVCAGYVVRHTIG